MIDLKNGIVEFNGIVITRDSTPDDFNKLPKGTVQYSTSRRFGGSFYKIAKPVSADGIEMSASIDFLPGQVVPQIELRPYGTKDCREAFAASHKWLESVLEDSIEVVDYILVLESNKMKVSSIVKYTPRDGLESGGSIEIKFY